MSEAPRGAAGPEDPAGGGRTPASEPGPRLASLGGRPAPAELVSAVRSLESMPAEPRRVLWRLLGPALDEPPPEGTTALGEAFAREHELNPGRLAMVVAGCRELMRAAVALGVDRESFARDLDRLAGEGSHAKAVLLAGFSAAERRLTREYLRRAVERHGRHAADFEWRVDHVAATDYSRGLRAPVLTVTFDCAGTSGHERITLQLLPDVAARLQKVLQLVTSAGGEGGEARERP